MGGLGNQLFQIFTVISTCIRYNVDFIFPYSDTLKIGVERPTYWNSFFKNIKRYTANSENYNSNVFINDMLYKFQVYHERSFNYREIPKIDNIMLNGYFQSYKYFHDVQYQVFELIGIREMQAEILNEYPELLNEKNTISMHFRLGDYKVKQDCHPILPYDYYEKTLEMIQSDELLKYRILYFCEKEDNEYVNSIIEKLKLKFNIKEFIKVDDTIADWKQMLIMSCCKINIIANSSYSWWAAYFNINHGKVVFYPSMWFGPSIKNDVSDMYPPEWIKILVIK
jgi:hypothetical protein